MATFAQIENNKVTQVIVISDHNCGGVEFPESEPIGQAFIASIGLDGQWLQTSENADYRGSYAGIGYTYDPDLDQFIHPPIPEIEEAPNE